MPAFRYEGHVVAGFLATNQGCSYYPFSGTTLATLAHDVRAYGQTKSALHFDPSEPLPTLLVKKLITARVAEEAARAPAKRTAAPKKKAAGGTSRASVAGTRGQATKPTGKRAAVGKRSSVGKRPAAARPAKKRARG